jgi:hypothetical protein
MSATDVIAGMRPPKRSDYAPVVKGLIPLCEGEELQMRCSILLVRDKSLASMRRCSEESHGVLAEVHRLASQYAFEAIPTEELRELRYRLVMLTACASGLEMFAYRLACPDGGANAGG